MGLIVGLLANTLIVAALIIWLSKGDGAKWINTLNGTSLSIFVSLLVIIETAGAVNGMFIWSVLNGKVKDLGEVLGYLGIWFGFLGTHVLALSATTIGKRVTDGGYVEKKGDAKAKVEAAKTTNTTNTANAAAGQQVTEGIVTGERPAMRPSQQVNVVVEGDPPA
jgi:hypothetical protein